MASHPSTYCMRNQSTLKNKASGPGFYLVSVSTRPGQPFPAASPLSPHPHPIRAEKPCSFILSRK